MSRRTRGWLRALVLVAFAGAMTVGIAVLTADPVAAKPWKPPGPLCGPDILWSCTMKDGSTQLVGATRCDIAKFEKKNKATCVPATF